MHVRIETEEWLFVSLGKMVARAVRCAQTPNTYLRLNTDDDKTMIDLLIVQREEHIAIGKVVALFGQRWHEITQVSKVNVTLLSSLLRAVHA